MKTTIHILLVTMLMACCTAVGAATYGKHTFAQHSALATGTWVKVMLDGTEDGIYQITYDQLSQMGFKNPANVGIYGFGGHPIPENIEQAVEDDLPEVAAYHDDGNRRILFYGRGLIRWDYSATKGFYHRHNTSESHAYYFLHQKNEPARQMETLEDNASAMGTIPTQDYDVYLLHEQNLINLGRTGREKYGESLLNITTQSFDFPALNEGNVRLTVNIAANASGPSKMRVKLNGTDLDDTNVAKTTNEYAFASEATFDRTVQNDSPNGLTVGVSYVHPTSGNAKLAHLNYIKLQGKRAFAKPRNYELFRSGQAYNKIVRFNLHEAMAEGIQVWDVTSGNDVKLQAMTSNTFSPQEVGVREYALVNTQGTGFPGVSKVETMTNQDLHGLPMTNMVIVTAPAYLSQANRLAEYRRLNDGLHVTVLTPQEIYNEFASGAQDVTAIRLLMKMFYDRYHQALQGEGEADEVREPLYLLLVGDGYYDNLAIDRNRFLPTYETDASLAETSSCVCDDYFGFLDDNEGGRMDSNLRYTISSDVLDIGIGRLPVSSEQEATGAVNKIIAYSENRYLGNWKNRICFLSDDDKEGDSFNCHVRHNDQLVARLEEQGHKEFTMQKIYLPAYTQTKTAAGTDYPDAKKEFQESLKQGVLMVNYAGHGNTTAITNENMMTAALASQLNMKYLPLWVTASCDVARWDNDDSSMGENLFLNPNGGAIALLTTVRVVYAQQNLTLNQAIIDNIFNRFSDGTRYRLGDVMKAAKQKLGSDYNKLNFCLMGDPSLTLAYPEHKMKITEVNSEPVDETFLADNPTFNFPLEVLSKVTMRGQIYTTGSDTEVDTDFNGLVYPTLYDALETLNADKGYVQDEAPTYSFNIRTKKAFSGRGEVRAGEFEFSFIVPQDIAYSDLPGLANLYACSDDGREGQGYFDRYVLTGGEEFEKTDNEGPRVNQLFLNDAMFYDGATVNSTPYFYAEIEDESGFNATGNTVGHDMVLTIRCTSNPLLGTVQHTLNNYFTTYTGNSTIGNIQYSIPAMADGTYEATFRVWDVYNNATIQQFSFTVDKGEAPATSVVQAYPSPARMGDTITFRVLHNRPESAQEVQLQVFTQTGFKVFETTATSTSAQKVYAPADAPTEVNHALNADESGDFMGSATITWDTSDLRAGFYVYRVVMTSNGSSSVSESKVLMVNP